MTIKKYFNSSNLLLLLIATFSGWFAYHSLWPQRSIIADNSPDAIIHNLTTIHYNQQGQKIRTLHTPYLESYHKQKQSIVSKPQLIFYDNKANPTHLYAQRGIYDKTKLITLLGKVTLIQHGEKNPTQMQTEQLTINPKKQIAYTQESVNITQGTTVHITAQGARADLNKQTLMLNHKVNGNFQPSAHDVNRK